MKKIIAKVKDHAHGPHHSANDHDGHSDDNALRASLYEDTSSQAPPRLGTTPIKGDNYEPPPQLGSASSAPASANVAASEPSHQPQAYPQVERQQPVNFSRLPVNRVDVDGRKPIGPGVGTTSSDADPSRAIQPRDLASPEYSYLSKVYGKGPSESRTPAAGRVEMADPTSAEQGIPRKQVGTAMSPVDSSYDVGRPPALPPRAVRPQDSLLPNLHLRGQREPTEEGTSVTSSSTSSRDPSEMSRGPAEPTIHETPGSSLLSESLPQNPQLIVQATEVKPSLEGIVDLRNTTDTDVIVTQAPAVVHETVIPQVQNIREEKIEREIHTYDVFHRIQPIIDVEVLPPRHFIPVEGGGLREVSADEIPGQTGHWGIVETVTKEPPARERPPPPSVAPKKISERTYMTEEGIMRTETTWKHPPTLATGARDTGQLWPMQISQQEFEARDGILGTNLPRKQPDAQDSTGALDLKPLEKDLSQVSGDVRRAPAVQTRGPGFVEPVSRAGPEPGIDNRTVPSSGTLESANATSSDDGQALQPPRPKRFVPGAFPSSTSTATIQTLPQVPPR